MGHRESSNPDPGGRSHVPAVLSTRLEQRAGDLAQAAAAHRVHQHLEHVAVLDHRLLQPRQLDRVTLMLSLRPSTSRGAWPDHSMAEDSSVTSTSDTRHSASA